MSFVHVFLHFWPFGGSAERALSAPVAHDGFAGRTSYLYSMHLGMQEEEERPADDFRQQHSLLNRGFWGVLNIRGKRLY